MKIMHIITRLIQGGAQQNTVISCRAQVAAGHTVTLVFGPIHGPEGSLLEEAKLTGAKIIILPEMVRELNPLKDFKCYRALRKLIRTEKPDIVHTHSSKAGIIGRAASWKENTPAVIHTVHGLPFHDHQSKLIHNLYVYLEQFAAKRCHHLIAITPAMVQAFAKKKIASPEKFSVIPSGVDLSRFRLQPNWRLESRAMMKIPQSVPVIANLARLDALKGHDDLLDIYPDLATALGPETRLLFIGDGYNREHLENKIASLGFSDRVIITGYIPHKEIARTLSAADVKVLPSYQEGQSRTLVEALLCKIPIIGYNVGGIPSICIDHVTGRLVPLGDKSALAETIIETLKNPEKTRKLTDEGRKFVTKQYSSQAMTDALEHLYQSLRNRDQFIGL
ncbi:glycosyltransferase family 4 protein [Poriferisphaera sp. WC338]|uniref:glycosyltransferase family 4 protein n=1 Tax=Poriferisphaera sp. WC338 TaxID=3425129 RepID=UPI003D81A3CF